jgi:dTDP-4-dehydrorhamnose reductase
LLGVWLFRNRNRNQLVDLCYHLGSWLAGDRSLKAKGARLPDLELWGGAECTLNRVGDVFRDQLCLTGHYDRPGDLDLLAGLGLRALRFPLLWERVAPSDPQERDWSWSDGQLARLREHGIRPIAGLVHHGSGPRYTSLLDEGFAAGLAQHALAAAERYPWIEDWTPVNEPLTTARFAALYGHWYPHARDERSFYLALLNQIDGVRAAMRAIRTIIPAARLIQTDDLGRTYATAVLSIQAGFDNVRRWLGWDLLCGRVIPGHDLWPRLCGFGLEPRLRSLAADPCPPDIIGVNHYLTSDRYLDHRLQRYPPGSHGGNQLLAFADVEAVRVVEPPPGGLRGALQEAWERYRLPLAATEVHNGCTREEQMRWLAEAWRTATDLRAGGVDIRAVTAWALLGSQGWDRLLTAPGVYEPGAFDVSSGTPRPTRVAKLMKSLATAPEKVSVDEAGWWNRDIRLLYPSVSRPAPMRDLRRRPPPPEGRPILLLGATGTLGQALARACRHRGLAHRLIGRGDLDLANSASFSAALDRYSPWAVVNAAGWVRVDDAELEPGACMLANAEGPIALAEACHERGIATVNFSSDLVFGNGARRSRRESDEPAPLNAYGESKMRMEGGILSLGAGHLVIRTAAFFSPWDAHNFAVAMVRSARQGARFAAAADCVISPTYVPDLCRASLDLLLDGESGIWHLSNETPVTWAEFAAQVAEACLLERGLIDAVPHARFGWKAARPTNCALASEKGAMMPSLESAVHRFAEAMAASEAMVRSGAMAGS